MGVHTVGDGPSSSIFAGASCAFGVFDGLHVGHRYLIDQACLTAARTGGRSIALTFDIDPDELFCDQRLKKLMRNADRIAALEASGVDDVAVLPFTSELARLAPLDFLQQTFGAGAPAFMHVGEDFRFGAKASGTVGDLEEWGKEAGCEVRPHRLVSADGLPVTATRIRALLLECELDEATRLLGHPYTLRETVRRGRGEGARFGFATANLSVAPHDRVLGEGVYAAWANLQNERYKAAVSVGVSPTFQATSQANMEVHVLDFTGDLVGRDIEVSFERYLRPMRKFDTTEELIAAVKADIAQVRASLAS